eukprot:NODE_252_length_11723_cov_1.965933.p3 type:complete len:342 gc:universal NODE_252_length_11723_cov_1.965933:10952-9927(-)
MLEEDQEIITGIPLIAQYLTNVQLFYNQSITNLQHREYFDYVRLHDPIEQIENNAISRARFIKIYRLSPETFISFLDIIKPHLDSAAPNTTGRPRINDSIRFGMFLYYCGRDPDIFNAGFAFGLSESTARRIIYEFTDAILQVFDSYISLPSSIEQIKQNCSDFKTYSKSIFPNVCGAIDGVHFPIAITEKGTETSYYNHKGFYSLNCICMVDAKCRVIGADLGIPGCRQDSYGFNTSNLKPWLDQIGLEYVVVADGGFPIQPNMFVPFDINEIRVCSDVRNLFNLHLSRARVKTEMTFGMIKRRWKFLSFAVAVSKSMHVKLTKALMIIHNYCIDIGDCN